MYLYVSLLHVVRIGFSYCYIWHSAIAVFHIGYFQFFFEKKTYGRQNPPTHGHVTIAQIEILCVNSARREAADDTGRSRIADTELDREALSAWRVCPIGVHFMRHCLRRCGACRQQMNVVAGF